VAFSTSELARIKAELGYNLLEVGADPWIGISQLFEQVVNEHIAAEIATTSSTAVTAQDTPTPVTLTLTAATGFVTGQRCVVDVDARQELATLQNLSGTSATFLLLLAHSGTYPVSVEGPIPIAKYCLHRIATVKAEMAETMGYGALKKVDEVEFYETGRNTRFGLLGNQLRYWRDELASVLGVPNRWSAKQAGSSALSVY
jgi:hypothetical protein